MADKKIVDLTQSQTIADSDYVFVNQSGEPVWVPASKVKSYASGDIAGGTTDYTSLTNKPQIGGVELVGNKTLDQLGIQPKIAEVLEGEIVIENPVKTSKVVAEQEVVAPKVSANQVEAGNLYKKTEIDTMVDAKIDKNQGSGNSGKYLRVGSDGNVELVNAPSGGGSGTGTSDYNDLTNKPQINGVSLSGNKTLDQLGIQAKGNYLTSIPDVYVTESELGTKVDKNQGTLNSGKYLAVGTDGNIELVDAPSGGEGGTSNYNSLTNRPQINGVTLTGNKTAADLNLQAAGDYLTSVPKATSAVYGGIKAATATVSDTVPVRIKSDGTLAVATYPVLATATSTALGGIKADAKTSSDTVPVRIDASTGKLYVQTYPTSGGDGSGYVLPQATSTELGGVKATLATSAYTDEVRIKDNGKLVVQAYALKASPTFTGTPKAPTATSTTNNTQIATTAFVHSLTDNKLDKNQGSANSGKYLAVGSDGNIQYVSAPSGGGGSGTNDYESLLNRPSINGVELTGNKSLGDLGISIVPSGGSTGQVLKKTSNANGDYAWADETGGGDVDLTGYAKLASPTFTGIPKAPTAATSTNTTQIATTAFVKAQGYAALASPTFTGTPRATTATKTDDSTRIATTAFVKDVVADYAPLTGAELNNPKTNSPATDSNDSSIPNTLWVNYKLSQLDLGGGTGSGLSVSYDDASGNIVFTDDGGTGGSGGTSEKSWELVADITTEEETSVIEVTQKQGGGSFEYDEFYLILKAYGSASNTAGNKNAKITISGVTNNFYFAGIAMSSSTVYRTYAVKGSLIPVLNMIGSELNTQSATMFNKDVSSYGGFDYAGALDKFTSIRIAMQQTPNVFGIGSRFILYAR